MRHATLDVIHEEHQALAAMLRSLLLLLQQARRQRGTPDFEVLRAMLFYVDEFPERLHHPNESGLLFPAVLRRCPRLQPVVDELTRQHEAGARAVRELQHALLAFEMMGEPRRAAFEAAADRYTRFYLDHMALEEDKILPAAAEHLTPEDWAPLDEAFGAHRDPLAGHEPAPDYQRLFGRILARAPAPIGLGPPTASSAAPA